MNTNEISAYLHQAKKKTPVKVYVKSKTPISFTECKVFGETDQIVFGEWNQIQTILLKNKEHIIDYVVEATCRNSAIPLLSLIHLSARIEPGAIIRDHVEIKERVIVMMGAIINIGAVIDEDTMIDMGTIIGGNAKIGKRCHIGAGAVLAGVIEPANAKPVIVEDDVMIGANAVILEGIHIHKGAVIGAGAIVLEDVEEESIVVGNPAKVINKVKNISKTEILPELRKL